MIIGEKTGYCVGLLVKIFVKKQFIYNYNTSTLDTG